MGKLYFNYSTMNAGKSTALLQAAYNYEERGMAVLFLSAAPHGGAPLPHMWHGGCRVRRGEKWTLQRFKELPQGHPSGGVFSRSTSVSQSWGGS